MGEKTWGQVAKQRNKQDVRDYKPGGNPLWRQPDPRNQSDWVKRSEWKDTRLQDDVDDPSRSFTTRKRHGWWGKEEKYDESGRRLDGSGSRRRAWFFDEGS